ncbi:MAG: hypothetical protein WCJ30_15740, partial [Deltaproteobacteria bacterium]
MNTRPVQSHAPSSDPSLDHVSGPAVAPQPSHSQRASGAQATHRGPDVIVDHQAPSNATRRLQAIQQRAQSSAEPSPPASREAQYAATVASYRNLMVAGLTPAPPPAAPRLPAMSGDELIAGCHVPVPDFHAALRSAEHAAETNQPWGLQEHIFAVPGRAIEAATGLHRNHASLATEVLAHFGVEALALPHEMAELVAEFSGAAAGHSVAAAVSTAASVIAVADATSMFFQDMRLIAQGRFRPTPAILQAM